MAPGTLETHHQQLPDSTRKSTKIACKPNLPHATAQHSVLLAHLQGAFKTRETARRAACDKLLEPLLWKFPLTRVTATGPLLRVTTSGPLLRVTTSSPLLRVTTSGPLLRVTTSGPLLRVTTSSPLLNGNSFSEQLSTSTRPRGCWGEPSFMSRSPEARPRGCSPLQSSPRDTMLLETVYRSRSLNTHNTLQQSSLQTPTQTEPLQLLAANHHRNTQPNYK